MQSDKSFDNYDKEFITFTIEQAGQLYIRLMGLLFALLVVPFMYVHFPSFQSYFSSFSGWTFLQDFFLFIIFY